MINVTDFKMVVHHIDEDGVVYVDIYIIPYKSAEYINITWEIPNEIS